MEGPMMSLHRHYCNAVQDLAECNIMIGDRVVAVGKFWLESPVTLVLSLGERLSIRNPNFSRA